MDDSYLKDHVNFDPVIQFDEEMFRRLCIASQCKFGNTLPESLSWTCEELIKEGLRDYY